MADDKLRKQTACRSMALGVMAIREDVVQFNIGEYMKAFPDMTRKQNAHFIELISKRHDVFKAVSAMNRTIRALERKIK